MACNRKKEEFEEEIKNAKGMLGAIAMIHKAIVNPSMATKYAINDVEKSLRKQAAESEKDDELNHRTTTTLTTLLGCLLYASLPGASGPLSFSLSRSPSLSLDKSHCIALEETY